MLLKHPKLVEQLKNFQIQVLRTKQVADAVFLEPAWTQRMMTNLVGAIEEKGVSTPKQTLADVM